MAKKQVSEAEEDINPSLGNTTAVLDLHSDCMYKVSGEADCHAKTLNMPLAAQCHAACYSFQIDTWRRCLNDELLNYS
jgi:hypothetical protein